MRRDASAQRSLGSAAEMFEKPRKERVFLAYAGMNRSARWAAKRGSCLPRARGDKPKLYTFADLLRRSSPHTRDRGSDGVGARPRFPAPAGMNLAITPTSSR